MTAVPPPFWQPTSFACDERPGDWVIATPDITFADLRLRLMSQQHERDCARSREGLDSSAPSGFTLCMHCAALI